jgi:archaellum component FlaG (FlaF/FlaG flagellin family)
MRQNLIIVAVLMMIAAFVTGVVTFQSYLVTASLIAIAVFVAMTVVVYVAIVTEPESTQDLV